MLTSRSLKASGSLLVVLVMIVMMMMVVMMVMEVVMMGVVMKMVLVVVMMVIGSEADLQVTKGTCAYRPLIQRSRVQLPTALSTQ